MPQARKITLTAAEEATLVEARDNHPVPYSGAGRRDAQGRRRLVRPPGRGRGPAPAAMPGDRRRLDRLLPGIRGGRLGDPSRPRRKPAYARAGLRRQEQAAAAVLDQVHRSHGGRRFDPSRWTLATLLTTVLWLRSLGVSGLSRLLSRLKSATAAARSTSTRPTPSTTPSGRRPRPPRGPRRSPGPAWQGLAVYISQVPTNK